MAYHNQRGFGRPTVTAMLAVAEYFIEQSKEEYGLWYDFNHNTLRHILCRPYGWDEYFKRIAPYECSAEFKHNEHSNNDWYAIIDIDIDNKDIDCRLFWDNDKQMSPRDYIRYTNTENFCSPEWREWMDEKSNLLFNYKLKWAEQSE